MPTYVYQCDCPSTWTAWQSIHSNAITTCEKCGGHALRVLGPVRTSNMSPVTRQVDATERQWNKDRPAYKRLRHAGHQPPNVDGADRLEALATNEFEVNSGLRYGPIPEQKVKDGMSRAHEAGWSPHAPQ